MELRVVTRISFVLKWRWVLKPFARYHCWKIEGWTKKERKKERKKALPYQVPPRAGGLKTRQPSVVPLGNFRSAVPSIRAFPFRSADRFQYAASDQCCGTERVWLARLITINFWSLLIEIVLCKFLYASKEDAIYGIRESVDSLCRDGADAQYMQYQVLSKSRITSPQTRKKLI